MNDNQSPDKVKALAERIIEECKQQDFTIEDVICLVSQPEVAYTCRQNETYKELF